MRELKKNKDNSPIEACGFPTFSLSLFFDVAAPLSFIPADRLEHQSSTFRPGKVYPSGGQSVNLAFPMV